jgi:hypothetical protein
MKGFSSFGAILILLVGLAMTAIDIYANLHPEIFLDNKTTKIVTLSILNGACGLIIIGSLVGMCGIKKGSACLIGIFQILVILFLFFSQLESPQLFFPINSFKETVKSHKIRRFNRHLGFSNSPKTIYVFKEFVLVI